MSFRSCYRHKKTSKAADLCVLSVCFRGIIYISGLFFCSLPSDVFLKNQAVEHCLLTIPGSMRASVSDRLPFRIVCRQTIPAVTAAPFFIRQEVRSAAGTFLLRNEISPCFLTLRITGPLQLQGTRLFFLHRSAVLRQPCPADHSININSRGVFSVLNSIYPDPAYTVFQKVILLICICSAFPEQLTDTAAKLVLLITHDLFWQFFFFQLIPPVCQEDHNRYHYTCQCSQPQIRDEPET